MTKTTETPLVPTMPDIGTSIQRLTVDGSRWLTNHYVELIFAVVIRGGSAKLHSGIGGFSV